MPAHSAVALLVASTLTLGAANGTPRHDVDAVDPVGTLSPDDASVAGPPISTPVDLTAFFTPPATELPDGTVVHTPSDDPDWSRVFDPDRAPEWSFVPAPAPDLFVSEPDYGGVDAGLVHVASAVLGSATPWELEREEADALVATAAEEAAVVTTLTRTSFDEAGLLEASRELGDPADTLWDLDVGVLSAAASSSLERAMSTWGVAPLDTRRPGEVTAALRAAQERAGLPGRINGRNLARLSTRTAIAQADGASHGGVTLQLGDPEAVAGLLQRRDLTVRLGDGAVARGHVLLWHPDDPEVELRTDLAAGWGARATVADAAARLGAVAAVNGGFWLDASEPDGLLVTAGRVQSDATAWTGTKRGIRGAVGVAGDRIVIGRADWQIHLRQGDRLLGVDALNRPARPGQTVAWNHGGPAPSGTAASWWMLADVGGAGEAVRLPGPVPPGPGQLLVATHHDLSGRWESTSATAEGWDGLEHGLGAGPRLVYDGSPTPEGWWLFEGFAPAHTHQRHPRTAIGVDRHGAMIVLVLDGRQPDWSVGATQAEAQSVMIALGVRDATMLDGGGSTQLVVGGAVRNRPCCDARTRAVATVAAFVPRRD